MGGSKGVEKWYRVEKYNRIMPRGHRWQFVGEYTDLDKAFELRDNAKNAGWKTRLYTVTK